MNKLRGVAIAAALLMVGGGLAACGSPAGSTEPSQANAASGKVQVPEPVRKAGVVNLAAFLNSPPFRYLDSSNQPVGIEVEMANAIGQVMGVKVQIHDVAFDATIPSVAAGRYDWALGFLQDSAERRKVVDFLDWVYSTDSVLTQKGNPKKVSATSLCGVSIANTEGSQEVVTTEKIIAECKAAGKPATTNLQLKDFAQAQQAVLSGRADVLMTNPATLTYLVKQTGGRFEQLPGAVPQSGRYPAGWQFSKQRTDLQKAVYQAIGVLIENGTWQRLLKEYGMGEVGIVPPTINVKAPSF